MELYSKITKTILLKDNYANVSNIAYIDEYSLPILAIVNLSDDSFCIN